MSGDVQPRKRKDKKRKKDDSGEQIPTPPQTPPIISPTQNEDLNIHVHKEDGTGGGICAKIIFFLLFSALAVLIGLIITEHRGLTDLDTADQESRFSHLFEGWIDNSVNHEDDHDNHIVSSLEDEEHDEHDEDESLEAHHDDEHEEEQEEEEEEEEKQPEDELSEEVSQEEEEEEEENKEDSQAEDEDVSQPEDEEDEEDEDEEDEETGEDEEQALESEEQEAEDVSEGKDTDEISEEKDEEEEEEEEDEEEEEEIVASEEAEKSVEEEKEEEDDEGVDNEVEEEDENEVKEGGSEEQSPEKESEEVKEEKAEKEDEEAEEAQDKKGDEENEEGEEIEDPNNSKSVNVRHDNEPEESDSEKQSDDDVETYEYENITSKDDLPIKEKIDEAQKNIKNNAAYAIKLFDALLQNYPSSPRSLYGKAQALDVLADQRRSNEILQKAITLYLKILDLDDVPEALYEAVGDRCINRLRFMGNYHQAINVHNKLIARFPNNFKHKNQLVVSYLTINRVKKARMLLEEVLSKNPNDGFALVHYGFILKTVDNNLNEAVSYLQRGIATKESGVIDGRFYFHLGDALARLGRNEEAMKVYEEGVEYKLFLSKYQRSLYNLAHLEAKPWWKKEDTPYTNLYAALESNWEKIRNEGLAVLKKNGLFQNESENLKNTGDWKQFELFARGQKNIENCKKCPFTCKIIESIPDARGCKRGQTKFSVMHPGTHVWPHCGPTNCRLRVHLGLQVPEHTYIRVADEIRSWEDGKVFIFDDSFEHEVWHNGTTLRLVLIVDVWHPQLTLAEKRSLSPI